MLSPAIMDAVAAAVLLGFVLWGAKKGLLRSLAGFLVVLVSLFGASMIASTFSAPAAKLLAPAIEKHIETRVEEEIRKNLPKGSMPGTVPEELEDLLDLLGLDAKQRDTLADQARETIRETGASAATAVVENLARSFLYGLLYTVSFTVLSVLLHLLVRGLNLVFRLPGLHGLNALGGGLLGLLEGALLLFLAAWVMRLLGVGDSIETESRLFRFFALYTPLDALAFLGK